MSCCIGFVVVPVSRRFGSILLLYCNGAATLLVVLTKYITRLTLFEFSPLILCLWWWASVIGVESLWSSRMLF